MAKSLCDVCSALCCRYFALPLDPPSDVRDYDNMRWYLMHENVIIFIEDGDWYLAVLTRCKHLQQDNRCGIYETRPRICRSYTTDNCEFHGMDYDYDQLFTSAEQLVEYGEKQLGRKIIYQPKKNRVAARRIKSKSGSRRVRLMVV